MTALDILNTLKEKKDKGNVLVLGGSGGVGHLLIQLLQIHGYNVTAGASIKNFAFLKELGTNEIFDYHDDYKTKYKDQFDAAIDFIGDDIGIGLYEVLKENGLLVTVPSYSFNKVISACPSCKQVKSVLAAPSREKIAYLLKLCSSGKLKVHITKDSSSIPKERSWRTFRLKVLTPAAKLFWCRKRCSTERSFLNAAGISCSFR